MSEIELKEIISQKHKNIKKANINPMLVLFSCISNNNIINVNIYAVLLIIEWLHLIYLPMRYVVSNSNDDFKNFSNIVTIVNYFRLTVNEHSEIGIILVSAFHTFVLLLIITCSVIILCCAHQGKIKKAKFINVISTILSSTLTLMLTIFLIPMIGSFIFPSLCFDGEIPIYTPSYLVCGSAGQIALFVIGIFLAFLTTCVQYGSTNILIDDYWMSSLPWAGESKDSHVMHEFYKLLLALYLATDLDGTYAQTAIAIFLVLQAYLLWKRGSGDVPYSKVVFILKVLSESCSFVLYLYALIGNLYESYYTMWSISFAIIIGICIGILLIMSTEGSKKTILRKNWLTLKTETESEEYVKSLCRLCVLEQGSPEWSLMIRYLVYLHSLDCQNLACICKIHKDSTTANVLVNKEMEELWLKIYEGILETQAIKYEHSRDIIMSLSYFESVVMKNFFKSYYWLLKVDGLKNPFTERFLCYRMKQILERQILHQESKAVASFNVASILKFQKVCNGFQKLLAHSTNVVISFWSLLETPKINVRELYRKGQKITIMLKYVNDLFKKVVELNPDYPYTYFYYGRFTYAVLNSENLGTDWIERGRDILKQQQESRAKYKENISKSTDTAIIVISGSLDTLGIVQSANEHVEKQLGFEPSDLIDRNISRVMPKAIGEVHDNFLLNNVKIGAGGILKGEVMVFSQTKEGLIEPVCLEAKTLPGLERGLQYIGFVKKDMTKIRSKFMKLPSQYKTQKVGYIMTDEQGYMVGLSKHACGLFGLSSKYIMRKKGLTNSPYPISRLAPELGSSDMDKKLEAGTELTIHTNTILEYLDYDYLKGNEENVVLEHVNEDHKAFIMLLKLNYQNLIKLKVFIIADLGKVSDVHQQMLAHQIFHQSLQNDFSDDDEEKDPTISSTVSMIKKDTASSASSSSTRSTSKGTVSDIKKKASTRERTASIKRLIFAIFVFIILIIANGGVILGIFVNNMKSIDSMHKIFVNSCRRLTHFNMLVNWLVAYMNTVNGLQLYALDGFINTQQEDLDFRNEQLDRFKEDQFNLLISVNSHMPQISPQILYQDVNFVNMNTDFTLFNTTIKLNIALVQLLGLGAEIGFSKISDAFSKYYTNSYLKTSPSDTLTQFEAHVANFIINAYGPIHDIINDSRNVVYNEIIKIVNDQEKILTIGSCFTYGIALLFAVVFIPILLRIKQNKRNLLILFGEIPLSTVKKLNDSCKEFLQIDLAHLNDSQNLSLSSSNPNSKNNQKNETHAQKIEEKKQLQNDIQNIDHDEVTSLLKKRTKKKNEDEIIIEMQENSISEETTNEFKNSIEKAQEEKEETFMHERKNAINKVPVGLGNVTISVALIFAVILGYHTKVVLTIRNNYSSTKEDLKGLLVIHSRFCYVSNGILFYFGYLKSFDNFGVDLKAEDNFLLNLEQIIHNEKQHEEIKVFPSPGLHEAAKILEIYDSPKMCDAMNEHKIINGTQWCKTAFNGLLNEGLKNAISYLITYVRNSQLTISNSKNGEEEKLERMANTQMAQSIQLFVGLFKPFFNYLADQMVEIYSNVKFTEIKLLGVDFGIEVFLSIIGLLVFIKYFIRRMEEELFMARGILALLPENMIKSSTMLEKIIEGHQL